MPSLMQNQSLELNGSTITSVACILCALVAGCGSDVRVSTDDGVSNGRPNLPPSGRFSRGHFEVPAQKHTPPRQVNMLTLVKTDNWIQHHDGRMEYFSVHRYGEIFVLPSENLRSATLTMLEPDVSEAHLFDDASVDYRSFFFEGGYYADLAALDESVPGTEYRFDMVYADGTEHSHTVSMPRG